MKIDEDTIIVLAGILVLLIIVGFVVYGLWSEKKRREALQQFAQENSMVFVRDDKEFSEGLTKQPIFDIFRQGHSRKAHYFLRGQRFDLKTVLFDYRYTTGSGNHQQIHQQTIAMIDLERPELVSFVLKPRGFFQKVSEMLGKKGIEFTNRPEFSQHYVLKGSDESRIRQIFNDSVLALFEQHTNLSCEATEGKLLVYRQNHCARLEELRGFLDNALQILDLLRRPTISGDLYDFGIPKK